MKVEVPHLRGGILLFVPPLADPRGGTVPRCPIGSAAYGFIRYKYTHRSDIALITIPAH